MTDPLGVRDERPGHAAPARAEGSFSIASGGGLALGGIVLIAALLRFATLDQSFWFDEWVTIDLLQRGLGDMLAAIPSSEGTPPAYYVVAWFWTKLFGMSELGLRSLSAVLGTMTVPIVYAAGLELSRSRRVGLVAAALVAMNPLLIWYSQETRSYALLVFLTALSFLWFARVLGGDPRKRIVVGWALASALALASHYFAAFVVLPEALWLLVAAPGRRRQVALAATAIGAVALALAPLAYAQRGQTSWIGELDLLPRLGEIGPQFLVGFTAPDEQLWLPAAAVVLIAAVLLALRGDRRERRAGVLAAGIGGATLMLSLVAVLAGRDYVLTRNVIGALVPLAIAAGIALGARRAGLAGLAGAVMLCGLGLVSVVASATDDSLRRPDWGAAADALEAPNRARLILATGDFRAEPLRHYLSRERELSSDETVEVSEVDFLTFEHARDSGCNNGIACHMPETSPLGSSDVDALQQTAIGEFELAERRKIGGFTLTRFLSEVPRTVEAGELLVLFGLIRDVESPRLFFQAAAPRAR